jgi:hypothetical protein
MLVTPWLILLGTAGLAGAGGWAYARARGSVKEEQLRRQIEEGKRKALAAGGSSGQGVPTPLPQQQYREPDPGAVINVPVDAEDFRQMQDAFCVCYRALREDLGKLPTVEQLRDCFLGAIYPDFHWPPVPGDPETAQLMWMIADHEARKLLADPSPCLPTGTLDTAGGGG